MSEPVQVYTACHFVTPIICGQNYSQVGNKKLIHLHLNWVEVSNLTSAQFEQKLIRTCTQVGHKSHCAKKTGKQGKVIALCSFLYFLLRLNLQNSLSGKSPWYPSTSNATGSKGPETTWQAGESGTTFLIFEKSSFGHFLKMACR